MHERVHMERSFRGFFKTPLCSALIIDSGHQGVLGVHGVRLFILRL